MRVNPNVDNTTYNSVSISGNVTHLTCPHPPSLTIWQDKTHLWPRYCWCWARKVRAYFVWCLSPHIAVYSAPSHMPKHIYIILRAHPDISDGKRAIILQCKMAPPHTNISILLRAHPDIFYGKRSIIFQCIAAASNTQTHAYNAVNSP